ncbi:MAG: hypothetical protein ACT6FC_02515 [Methanosarcinaceae archaeon]
MKVRIEIFENDGTEKASAKFDGKHWKEYVTNFMYCVDGTSPPSTAPSSEIPTQQPAMQIAQPPVQSPMQQQVFPDPQLQLQYYPHPPIQQPVFYYPQPVQYHPKPNTQSINPQTLQQAVFPINQPTLPQQYAAQPVAPLQSQTPAHQPNISLRDRINDTTLTISERLELFLKFEYPHVWFTSQEIQGHYERVYGFIKLSTVSTYLSRMYRKNLLQRRGNRTQREYIYICNEPAISTADGVTSPEANGIMQ